MTINERLKCFRKDMLELNQVEFASRLSMSQGGLSYLEQPGTNISDSTIKLICMTFGLSEEWLRTGEGDMYADKTPEEKLEDCLVEQKVEPLSIELIMSYVDLPPDSRQAVLEFFESYIERRNRIEGPRAPEESKKSRNSPKANAWAAEFKKDRLARKKEKREHFEEEMRQKNALPDDADSAEE